MPDPSTDRPDNREVENENLKPAGEGQPPRPATEPAGSKASNGSDKTRTDPGSGERRGDIGPQSLRDTPKVG
jgi:hypothetical protein